MSQDEREKLERDYALYLRLLDYYAKNRDSIKSMTDKEYRAHIDDILDEINHIRKLLDEAQKNDNKSTD